MVLVTFLVAAPHLVALMLAPRPEALVAISLVATALPLLVGCVLIYVTWRNRAEPATAAICGVGLGLSLGDLSLVILRLEDPLQFWPAAAGRVVLFTCAALVLLAGTRPTARRHDPVTVGLLLALAGAGTTAAMLAVATRPVPEELVATVVLGLQVVSGAGLGWALLRQAPHVGPVARLFAAAAVLYALARALSYEAVEGGTWVVAACLVIGATGAIVLGVAAVATAQLLVREDRLELDDLHQRVLELTAQSRQVQARMHEVRATVAGIASASELLGHGHHHLDVGNERRLGDMLCAEAGRLQRLTSGTRPPGIPRATDLDATLEPVITRVEVEGVTVDWQRSGLTVDVVPDELAETISILLENVERHAPGGPVTVHATLQGAVVEIRVRDNGPGVRRELRRTLFDWGTRSPGSPGEGIGLGLARELAERQGGYLYLADGGEQGCTFVMGIPKGGEDHVVDRDVAVRVLA